MGGASGWGAVGNLVNGFTNLVGQFNSDDEYNKALEAMRNGYSGLYDVQAPTLGQMQYEGQDPTELGKISEDPRLRGMQMQALDKLGAEVNDNGMTADDALAYQRARDNAGTVANGLQGATMQRMASRGMGGGIGDYAAQLGAGQAGANRASQESLQQAKDARDRKMQAIGQLGQMAGGVRGQDYGVASDKANAQDLINRYNNSLKNGVQKYNLGLNQQNYDNQLGLANARLHASQLMEDTLNGRGQRSLQTAAKWGKYADDTIGGFGGMGGGG